VAGGPYPISVTLAPAGVLGNYNVTYNTASFAINKAALTVAATNAIRPYGAANPTFTGTIIGIRNGDNITATYTTTATSASPIGAYPIVPTLMDPGGKLVNYIVSLNNGTLTVIQASTTTAVSAAPNPADFGQSVRLTATVAPVAPGAGTPTGTVTFLDGSVTLGTSTLSSADTATFTTSLLAAGSHSLTASYGGDPNFRGSASSAATEQVVCGVLINLSPSTVPLGGTITVTSRVVSCARTPQTVVITFSLSGPLQPNSCSSTQSVMFKASPFTLLPGISQTVSFTFQVPKVMCIGAYSVTVTTSVNGVVVDTSSATLTVTH
jgi:hypothetical protein